MSIKTYTFNYDFCESSITLEVDTEVFTEDNAKEALLSMGIESKGPIEKFLEMYALECLAISAIDEPFHEDMLIALEERMGCANGIEIEVIDDFELGFYYCQSVMRSPVYTKALEYFGEQPQKDMAIEEIAELTQALQKEKRGITTNTQEEIADVFIMLMQLRKIYGENEVDKWIIKKLCRLNNMITK